VDDVLDYGCLLESRLVGERFVRPAAFLAQSVQIRRKAAGGTAAVVLRSAQDGSEPDSSWPSASGAVSPRPVAGCREPPSLAVDGFTVGSAPVERFALSDHALRSVRCRPVGQGFAGVLLPTLDGPHRRVEHSDRLLEREPPLASAQPSQST